MPQLDLSFNVANEDDIKKYQENQKNKDKIRKEHIYGEKDSARARKFIFSPELINGIDMDHIKTGERKNKVVSDGVRVHLISRKYCPCLHLEDLSEQELKIVFMTVQSMMDMFSNIDPNNLNMKDMKNINIFSLAHI